MHSIECAFEGRVGQAPTLRQTSSGKPWCSLSVAVGKENEEGGTEWVAVSAFGTLSEIAAAIEKGARV